MEETKHEQLKRLKAFYKENWLWFVPSVNWGTMEFNSIAWGETNIGKQTASKITELEKELGVYKSFEDVKKELNGMGLLIDI